MFALTMLLVGIAISLYPLPTVRAAPPPHLQKQSFLNSQLTFPLVLPLEATNVELLTHTADFTFEIADPSDAYNRFALQLDASYRFENPTAEPTVLILKITEPATLDADPELALVLNGLPLNLFRTEGVGYTTQLQLNPDERATVELRYRIVAGETPLPQLAYPSATLSAWRGAPSLRVSIRLPASSEPESWLRIAPDGWRYLQSDDAQSGLKWLYDINLPDAPFVFEMIHPHLWQRFQQLNADATTDPTLYQVIGDNYRSLLAAVPLDAAYDPVRDRFYGQALAAYSAGIEQLQASARNDELGKFYAALAALYRTKVAAPDGSVNVAYSEAMVEAAQNALAVLPTNANEQRELTQWVVDGLQLLLTKAQADAEWIRALSFIDALADLPSDIVDHALLEQTKHAITVRQALQLLEEENRPAAFALAGDELTDDALLPPLPLRALFNRWAISATVTPATMEIAVEPQTTVERQADAQVAFVELVTKLQRAADAGIILEMQTTAPVSEQLNSSEVRETGGQTSDVSVGRLLIRTASDNSLASLTTAMPTAPEWAFLYISLRQLQPVIEQERAWLNRQNSLFVSLDLQSAAGEWQSVAANLDTEAVALEVDAANRNQRDAEEAERALRLRIQAANYRAEAQQWRKLAATSWLSLQLEAPAGIQTASRSWLITAATPPVDAALTSSSGYLAALISTTVLGMGLLLLLSTLLWRLL